MSILKKFALKSTKISKYFLSLTFTSKVITMKHIIRLIFTTVLLISVIHGFESKDGVIKSRLSHIFQKLPSIIKEHYRASTHSIDMNCVRNLFELPQNENIILKEPETTIFVTAALLKCWDDEKVFERYFDAIAHIYMKDYLLCMKWHLQQLEPDSILLDNFKSSQYEPGDCKNIFDFPYKGILQKHEKTVGPVDVFSCETVSGMNDFMRFAVKLVLAKYGEFDNEVKEAEMKKLKEYFKDITLKTCYCIIQRFRSDPEAHQQNDTLIFYLTQPISYIPNLPSSLYDVEYIKEYIENGKQMEEAIDFDCVNQKLNILKNERKTVLEVEATILIASAKLRCLKIPLINFSKLFLNFAVLKHQRSEKTMSCARYLLKQVEPTSKLLISSNHVYNDDNSSCYITFKLYTDLAKDYKNHVGDLKDSSCGAITDEFVKILTLKTLLLIAQKDEEVKKIEAKELFTVASDKLHKLAQCVFQSLD
ncbi:hypothetical protein ACKWTF_014867 [Chironomus riparius]